MVATLRLQRSLVFSTAKRLILRLEDHPIAIAEGEDTGDVDAVPRVAQRKGAAVAIIVHT